MPLKPLRRCAVDFADLYPSASHIARDAEKALFADHYACVALVRGPARIAL